MPRCLTAFDGAGELNGAAEQQELFGEGRLAGVRMGDDGEGTAALRFSGKSRQWIILVRQQAKPYSASEA